MATIADVARLAGVATSTVSYALSGKRPISEETRLRIAAAIAELGFTPDARARALASSRTMVLGLLVQFLEDEFPPAMLQYVLSISNSARAQGYDILMVTESDGPHALRRITQSEMVDGVVLLNVAYDDKRLPVLRHIRQPSVLVGQPKDSSALSVFDLDFPSAARSAVDHLVALGHRTIILVTPNSHVIERGGAYAWRFREAAQERAAQAGVHLIVSAGVTHQPDISAQINTLLSQYPSATALIVHNDAVIAALPQVLQARSITVPSDLSVVGVYSEDFGRLFSLPYSAIESSPDILGRLAVQSLIEQIHQPTRLHQLRLIPPELIDRGSTRASWRIK